VSRGWSLPQSGNGSDHGKMKPGLRKKDKEWRKMAMWIFFDFNDD
jgi:hypothetical protein